MSKLFSLKQWLTVPEAAAHLSSVFNESVSVADIYRFALAGNLVLSVNFVNHARAYRGYVRTIEEADVSILPRGDRIDAVEKQVIDTIPRGRGRDAILAWAAEHAELFNSGDLMICVTGYPLDDGKVIDFTGSLTTLRGVWDLPMLGGARLDIEHALQYEVGGPAVELTCLDGTLVVDPQSGQFAKVLEHFSNNEYADKEKKYPYDDPKSYYPAGGLPRDAPMVVRTTALSDFVQSLAAGSDEGASRPLRADARLTYARVIGALWLKAHGEGKAGSISADPHTAAASLANALANLGLEKPSADKIGRILAEEVPGAGIKVGSSEISG